MQEYRGLHGEEAQQPPASGTRGHGEECPTCGAWENGWVDINAGRRRQQQQQVWVCVVYQFYLSYPCNFKMNYTNLHCITD